MFKKNIDPHKYSGPIEDLEKGTTKSKKPGVSLIIGLILVLLGGGVLFLIYAIEAGEIDFERDIWAYVTTIPFWLIILIPFAFRKKLKTMKSIKGSKTTAEQKRIIAFVVAGIILTSALAFGVAIFAVSR